MIENRAAGEPDVILVGAGIMSATLGVFLKELEPALNIWMVETLEGPSLESSDAPSSALIWLGEEHRRRPGVDLAAMR